MTSLSMDFSTRLRAGGSNGKGYSAVSLSPLQAQGCGFLGIGRQRRGALGSLSFWTHGRLVPPARRSLKSRQVSGQSSSPKNGGHHHDEEVSRNRRPPDLRETSSS